jgi:hypothetical protein
VKVGRHDADDFPIDSVYEDMVSDDGGVAAVVALPQTVRDQCDGCSAWSIVVFGEAASLSGRFAEDAKGARRGERGGQSLRLAGRGACRGAGGDVDGCGAVCADVGEGVIVATVEEICGVGLVDPREAGDGQGV